MMFELIDTYGLFGDCIDFGAPWNRSTIGVWPVQNELRAMFFILFGRL
jgi:hypothetical protein